MKVFQKVSLALIAGMVAAAILSCNNDDDGSPEPEAEAVVIDNMTFSPGTLSVSVGTTVTWINNDDVDHTTTSSDGEWNSGILEPGESFSHSFNETGNFDYICTLHPDMTGQVAVE